MKKLLSLSVMLGLSFSASAYDFWELNDNDDRIYYNITSPTTVEVASGAAKDYYTYMLIPDNVVDGSTTYNVTGIASTALKGQTRMTVVVLGSNIETIGENAFANCPVFSEFRVSAGNANFSVDNGYLYNVDKTKLVAIPSNRSANFCVSTVTTLGSYSIVDYVYSDNTNKITSFTIPENVTEIESNAFGYCPYLTSLTVQKARPADIGLGSEVFSGIDKNTCTLTVPYGSKSLYQAADQWKDFYEINESEPEVSLEGEANGHGWVDLGLTSGTKWSNCNVGASTPTEYGNFYAWGEPYTKSFYMGPSSDWTNYSMSQLTSNGVIDSNGNLVAEYDAAAQAWGGEWRMPTKEEWEELVDECTWTETTLNGKKGYNVTGPNGQSIFLIYAGIISGSGSVNRDKESYIWSSTPHSTENNRAYLLYIGPNMDINVDTSYRGSGVSVRAIIGNNANTENEDPEDPENPTPDPEDPENPTPDPEDPENPTPGTNPTIEEGARVKVGGLYYYLYPSTGNATLTYEVKESTSNYSDLDSIIVPESFKYQSVTFIVNKIGDHALNRVSPIYMSLPSSIITIEEESLAVITNLKVITIPDGVTTLLDNTFMKSQMEEIVLPNTVTSVPTGMAAFAPNLKKITIGSGVKSIGKEAFNYDNTLEEVICLAETPPTFSGWGQFTSAAYSNATLYVPKESLALYKASTCPWSKFYKIEPLQVKIELIDGQPYTNDINMTDVNVDYTRTFNNTNWQPLYIPFNMKYEDWCDYADVAEFAGVIMYDPEASGGLANATIGFTSVTKGELIPNMPYLIRAKNSGKITFSSKNCELRSANNNVTQCTTPRWIFALCGTYQPLSDEVHATNTYVMGGGRFIHTNGVLNPYRFYLAMVKGSGGYWGSPEQNPYPEEINVTVDGVVCGIEGIISNSITDDNYYDLLGRKVLNPTQGFYIKNGKKIFIR